MCVAVVTAAVVVVVVAVVVVMVVCSTTLNIMALSIMGLLATLSIIDS